jgi:hypothetical protein
MVGNAMHVSAIGAILMSVWLLEPIGNYTPSSMSKFSRMVLQRRSVLKRTFADI